MSDKKPLLSFSGGLDSTALLLMEADKKKPIDTFYVSTNNNSYAKRMIEQARRKRILEKVAKRFDIVINDSVLQLDTSATFSKYDTFYVGNEWSTTGCITREAKFTQPMLWLQGAMTLVQPSEHSEVMMGYVGGDQMIYYLERFANVWDSLFPILNNGDHVKLTFPLHFVYKVDLLPWYNEHLDIFKLTWTCERPELGGNVHVRCRNCVPCKRYEKEIVNSDWYQHRFRQKKIEDPNIQPKV